LAPFWLCHASDIVASAHVRFAGRAWYDEAGFGAAFHNEESGDDVVG
jgi:hypothetical protein